MSATEDKRDPLGAPVVGDTIQANDRGRWFEVTSVSPGGYHVSGYVGFDRSRHGQVSGIRLADVLAWVKGERWFFPLPHEAGEDAPS